MSDLANIKQQATGVAIQGVEGCFHQQAAQSFFGKQVQVVCCLSFPELIKKTADKQQTFAAVMAIENSIAGSILSNYNLLQSSDLKIVGEVYLHIKQQLLVFPGVSLADIREVHSHPMALLQCQQYLQQFNWKFIETEDTALSARHVLQHKCKHIAAVAGKFAGDMYGLSVIAPNIHTEKNNYTRFLVLKRAEEATPVADANKASVSFQTDHSRGSLARVLTRIAKAGMNLSKLQSSPIPGSDWLYSFHADMEFEHVEQFERLKTNLLQDTTALKVYGVYQSGKVK
ncbi:MAG: chorismate mutase [Chitinophagaceae bacterium]|nr:MAG: chorismate mutase [Chitinophagaceae bacterium]